MSILQYHFRSRVLNMSTSITVTIPDQSDGKTPWDKTLDDIYYPGKKYPTIYLCHGGSGDNTTWARNTQVELYGNQKRVMTVGMDLEESFCCDMKVGRNYFTYATEEVPRLVQALFPSSPAREDNFVAGFSMGGHCAMKIALRCPEKYAAVWAMSGAKDPVRMYHLALERGIHASNDLIQAAMGPIDEVYGTENDLLYLAKSLAESDRPKPLIFHSCGKQDYGLALCQEFADYLTSVGLKNEFFTPDGIHDYYYANQMLRKAIFEKFPIREVNY
ncbi:alpha/beta hydrolase-fold protein [Clostridium sp. AF32-12BH]|uniref:alpha/beta hydrolase n=1 Tax=Clostridium sp. AF32-12BH TaxID=2292006 RepID=UPI000E4BF21F|nr:alpha/beta hydrolase-fold protein [Clostridium sp. AF32-12BH]RHP47582.1 hypothetical protein DWZ40_06445 [Clostridium sp. AF32-12BH]